MGTPREDFDEIDKILDGTWSARKARQRPLWSTAIVAPLLLFCLALMLPLWLVAWLCEAVGSTTDGWFYAISERFFDMVDGIDKRSGAKGGE